jgi:hypothetical protein
MRHQLQSSPPRRQWRITAGVPRRNKIKKTGGLVLQLELTPDILGKVAKGRRDDLLVIDLPRKLKTSFATPEPN